MIDKVQYAEKKRARRENELIKAVFSTVPGKELMELWKAALVYEDPTAQVPDSCMLWYTLGQRTRTQRIINIFEEPRNEPDNRPNPD